MRARVFDSVLDQSDQIGAIERTRFFEIAIDLVAERKGDELFAESREHAVDQRIERLHGDRVVPAAENATRPRIERAIDERDAEQNLATGAVIKRRGFLELAPLAGERL